MWLKLGKVSAYVEKRITDFQLKDCLPYLEFLTYDSLMTLVYTIQIY